MADDTSLHLSDRLPVPRRFASKVDWWIAVALLAPFLLVVGLIAAGLSEPWVVLVLLAPQALVMWMLARTEYSVGEDLVVARCGPFRFSVPTASIRSLTASRSALSSPALSLDRIAVEHTGGRLLVSPRNKAGFVRAVLAVAPTVTVSGLAGADGLPVVDAPESTFNTAAIAPLIVLAVAGLAFGGWQFYAGTRAPEATVSGNSLSISGLYSTTIARQDVVRLTLVDHVSIGRKVQGFDAGAHLRGIFEVQGLGRSRVFLSRDASPVLVIQTRTQPVVIGFEDPARTRALHDDVMQSWGLTSGKPEVRSQKPEALRSSTF